MAVQKNPYIEWQKHRANADYRCTDTQVASMVRQQLSEDRFLRTRNRVNPGPFRNLRANLADSRSQVPHVFSPDDMWGWQDWPLEQTIELGFFEPGCSGSGGVIGSGLVFKEGVFEPNAFLTLEPLTANLYEQVSSASAPGASYLPYNLQKGATYTPEDPSFKGNVSL